MSKIYGLFKKIFLPYDKEVLDKFIIGKLQNIQSGKSILDLGCGSQQYRKHCKHLEYYGQDFGQSTDGTGDEKINYSYGDLDYVGNCWDVDEQEGKFDVILCTEVFEHIPYPELTLSEINRLLKKDGKLIITFPVFSLRHMDPYWFSPGYSDNWVKFFFDKYDFEIVDYEKYGDYTTFMNQEMIRVIASNKFASLFIIPVLVYFRFFYSNSKSSMRNLIFMGNHIEAVKKS